MNLTIIVIFTVITAFIGVGAYIFFSKKAEQSEASSAESLSQRISILQEGFVDQGLLESRNSHKGSVDLGSDISNFFGSFAPVPGPAQLALLNKAGLRTPNAHVLIFMRKLSGAVFGIVIGIIMSIFLSLGMSGIAIGLALAFMGWTGPNSEIRKRIQDRSYKIDKTLPDMIDLFANCCVAGVSFDIAAGYILNDLEDDSLLLPIKEDFLAWQSDVNLGMERPDSWKRLGERSDSKSIRYFTSLMNQSEKTGGSIAESLFKMSSFFRERRKQQLEAEIAQLPMKMSSQTIVFIVLPIVILLLGPVAINMFKTVGQVFGGGGA